MTKAVQLQVATERFIGRVLPKLFEHPDRAISEALQNSRRAGATEIRVLIAEDPSDSSRSIVTFADNGSGILDWSSLMTVAKSGWEADLADREDAFGVGSAALLFSAREVLIRSRGHELRLNQSDAVKGIRFTVSETRAAPECGTVIRLNGYVMQAKPAEQALERFAAGFPLPVYLGDGLLPAPFRLDQDFISTPAGAIRFNQVGATGTSICEGVAAFYQGLPIRAPLKEHYGRSEPAIVIHIDEHDHPAKAPDRGRLTDEARFLDSFTTAVNGHWAAFLSERCRALPPEQFVETYWHMAIKFQCFDLLAACPVLPGHVLNRVAWKPYLAEADAVFSSFGQAIRRDDVESGRVVLARAPDDLSDDQSMAFLTLVMNRGWVIVDDLPTSHWAESYVISIDEEVEDNGEVCDAWTVQVHAQPQRTDTFFGREVEFEFSLVQSYAICLLDASGNVAHSCESNGIGVFWGGKMIVPAGEDGETLVRQASYYLDENERFLENELGDDDAAFMDLIAELRGRTAGETLHKILYGAGAPGKPGMAGTVSVVMFCETGSGSSTDCAMHVIELSPMEIDRLIEAYPVEAAPLLDIAGALAPLVGRLSREKNSR